MTPSRTVSGAAYRRRCGARIRGRRPLPRWRAVRRQIRGRMHLPRWRVARRRIRWAARRAELWAAAPSPTASGSGRPDLVAPPFDGRRCGAESGGACSPPPASPTTSSPAGFTAAVMAWWASGGVRHVGPYGPLFFIFLMKTITVDDLDPVATDVFFLASWP